MIPHGTDQNGNALQSPANARWPFAAPRRTLIMGVINLTPDSFSDGGKVALAAAAETALAMVRDGADIIDIGGESTRPGATPVSPDEEVARVLPGVRAIAAVTKAAISIDTYRARTAAQALGVGATIINDVWGLQRDPDMARVAAEHGAGVCIMHNRSSIDPAIDIIADIRDFLARSFDIAAKAGVKPENIVIDPGIGFGKTFDQNLVCLQRLGELRDLGAPILVGCSRKGFIGAITGRAVASERLNGTLAAHVSAVLAGATIIRAHDVAPHREALALTDAIIRGSVAAQEQGS